MSFSTIGETKMYPSNFYRHAPTDHSTSVARLTIARGGRTTSASTRPPSRCSRGSSEADVVPRHPIECGHEEYEDYIRAHAG